MISCDVLIYHLSKLHLASGHHSASAPMITSIEGVTSSLWSSFCTSDRWFHAGLKAGDLQGRDFVRVAAQAKMVVLG